MIDLFDVDAAFRHVERNAACANGRRPGGTCPKTELRSHWHRQPHGSGAPGPLERHETPDPRRSDAVKARIQCVRPGSGGSAGVRRGRRASALLAGRPVCDSAGMSIFDDLGAEQERLEKILSGLDEAQWRSASAAEGWTIADVVLHLAQSEEAAAATATHGTLRAGLGAVAGDTIDARADAAVRMERAAPAEVFARWQRARQAALAAMRAADPDQSVPWMVGTLKPATLATNRLAEHWA